MRVRLKDEALSACPISTTESGDAGGDIGGCEGGGVDGGGGVSGEGGGGEGGGGEEGAFAWRCVMPYVKYQEWG